MASAHALCACEVKSIVAISVVTRSHHPNGTFGSRLRALLRRDGGRSIRPSAPGAPHRRPFGQSAKKAVCGVVAQTLRRHTLAHIANNKIEDVGELIAFDQSRIRVRRASCLAQPATMRIREDRRLWAFL